MKKPLKFEEAFLKNKARLVDALPFIAGARKPRSKPRSTEEGVGITIATAEIISNAYRSGKLVKRNPKGYVLR